MGLFNGLYKNYGLPKDKVLEWQFLVTGSDINTVKLSKKQLVDGTEMIVSNHRKIINDCVRLVNETLSPSVFFERYDLLISEMAQLVPFEPFYNFNKSINAQLVQLKTNRAKNEKAFINKYYLSVVEAANSLKTETGRVNRINKFFEIMNQYKDCMQAESWEYLNDLR